MERHELKTNESKHDLGREVLFFTGITYKNMIYWAVNYGDLNTIKVYSNIFKICTALILFFG